LRIEFVLVTRRVRAIALASVALLAGVLVSGSASAQNPETMMPEASATKAKQILAQMLDAMGGQNYLHVRELQCTGRKSEFGHNNALTSYLEFKEYWRFPDKYRIDLGKKGNIIDLFSGKEGWTVDHDGVGEEPADRVDEFQDRLMKDPGHLFRYRLKEEGMMYRYGGVDLIDLKPVEWVELSDREERTYRIAVQRDNHLMVRFTVITRDQASGQQVEEVTSYANYHMLGGVETPLQLTRTREGRRILQAFYDSCTYNPNLEPNFFSKAALQQRFQEVGSRADKRKAAKAQD
jgi:outer membrane lipoprotein-sorting protein